jgi:hypothetical protein
MDNDTTSPTEPDGDLGTEPTHAEGVHPPLPPTGPQPPPLEGSDEAFVAWLRSLVAPDGTVRSRVWR